MSSSLFDTLLLSSKIEPSETYDAIYESLPVVIAESTKELDAEFEKLQTAARPQDGLTEFVFNHNSLGTKFM